MGMFKKYDKLSPNYVPNNSYQKKEPEYEDVELELPIVEKDLNGTPIGYSWNYGDVFKLSVDLSTKVKVAGDAIVYAVKGEQPNGSTLGKYSGQQAYNTADAKSWTFVGISGSLFVWVEDKELTYPVDGTKEITINTNEEDDRLSLEIYNFRWEPFHTFSTVGSNVLVCDFDKELSQKFLPGVYPCKVRFDSGTGSVVKDKYTLVVK